MPVYTTIFVNSSTHGIHIGHGKDFIAASLCGGGSGGWLSALPHLQMGQQAQHICVHQVPLPCYQK